MQSVSFFIAAASAFPLSRAFRLPVLWLRTSGQTIHNPARIQHESIAFIFVIQIKCPAVGVNVAIAGGVVFVLCPGDARPHAARRLKNKTTEFYIALKNSVVLLSINVRYQALLKLEQRHPDIDKHILVAAVAQHRYGRPIQATLPEARAVYVYRYRINIGCCLS